MERTERIVLWVVVGLTFVGLITLTVVVFSELSAVNQQLLALTSGEISPAGGGEEPWWGGEQGGPPATPVAGATTAPSWGGQATQVGIAGVRVLTDSVAMTVTVRAYGAGDLLFEPPVLQSDEGQVYPVTGASLEEARLAFLDLVTRGEATAHLEFAGRLSPTSGLWLVFNPNQEPSNVTAPPLRVPVPLRTGGGGQ